MARREEYEKKRTQLEEICVKCRRDNKIFPPKAERCNSCRTGNKLRWLQTEYSDVTGWSHDLWNKGGM